MAFNAGDKSFSCSRSALASLSVSSMSIPCSFTSPIQANCQYQQYIVAKQNKAGLFAYDLKGNAIANKAFFLEHSFTEHDQWAVANNTLYQLAEDKASILALELTSAAEKVISFKGEYMTNFTAKYNTLLINDLPPDDTFIGKITIPKISETILSQ